MNFIFLAMLMVLHMGSSTILSQKQNRVLLKDENLIFREPPAPHPKSQLRTVQLETIEQRVDNFNPQNVDTFQMRYFRNDEFFIPGSPIFIYIGGEWSITEGWIRGGHMYDMAKEMNAQMYYTEHRYYGKSYPTPNATTENLRFLTIDQALADLAYFIVEKKKEPGKENSKVFIIGASYAATMSAWFRQKYPHLVVGAWSSSAPVNVKIDMFEYKEIVGAAVRTIGGEKCYRRLEIGIKMAEQLLNERNFTKLQQLFQLCDFDNERKENIWRIFSSLGGVLSGTVQYHWPGDIEQVCMQILNDTSSESNDLEEFARWYRGRYFADNDTTSCLDINYDNIIEYYQTVNWGEEATQDNRQWTYQTCTEFGWFQSSSSPYQPFGVNFPVEYNLKRCEDIFGKQQVNGNILAANVERQNTIYGGLNPMVTNVFFTHGKIDPWRTLGIQSDVSSTAPATIISTSAHCQDLYSINEFGPDTDEMLAVKIKIQELVKQWVQ